MPPKNDDVIYEQPLTSVKLQKTAYSHWSRAGLLWDHPVVRSVVRDYAENGPIHRKMVVACPLVITTKVKFFFRPNKTRKGE